MDSAQDPFIADELLKCSRCGYCLSTCPTYRVTRDERFVARGRNELVRQVCEGQMGVLEELRDPLFECLLCGACSETCFGSVSTDEIMVRAREAWHQEHGQPRVQCLIFDQLLPDPQRMTRLMRLLSMGKRSGLSELAHRLGALRMISPTLDKADGLAREMPRRFLRDRLPAMGFSREKRGGVPVWRRQPGLDEGASGPVVAYFIGCGTNYQLPAQGEAALRLLGMAGCELLVFDNCCCGLPPYSYGDRAAARRLISQNLATFAAVEFDYLVSECGSCSAFVKKWPSVIGTGPDGDIAASVAERTRDFTELLPDLPLPRPGATPSVRVTYHDPCHLVRSQCIVEQPRRLLSDVAGVEMLEMRESDWCCGGAGSYNLTHPELSEAILDRKMARVRESGADILATACPACVVQLSREESEHPPIPVLHVSEVICQSMGIEIERP